MRLKIFFLVAILLFVTSAFFPHRVSAQECGAFPLAPTNVKAASGPKAGEVILFWDGAAHANRYAVAYGTKSNSYQYGAHNIGGESARSYTIKSLQPGVRYYFRLAAARDCSSSPFSTEVWAVATGGMKIEAPPEGKAVPIGAPKVEAKPTVVKAPVSGPVGKAQLSARSGPKVGEVTLSWQHVDSAEDYHLVYGRSLGRYEYGALNIGRVDRFTVRALQPGTTYYFAIIPIFNNRPLYTTEAVKGVAKMNVTVIQTTPEALIKPKDKAPIGAPKPTKAPSTKTEETVPTATSSPEAKTTPSK